MNTIVLSALMGVVMMFAGIFLRKSNQIQWVAILGACALMIASIMDMRLPAEDSVVYFDMIEISAYSSWFSTLLSFCFLVYLFLFHKQIAAVGKNDADYFALMYFVMCGVYLLSSYTNLLILFLGIEIISIPQYILAGSDKESMKSNEASLKYFLMGAFGTGILLMAITLLYGATGSFSIFSDVYAKAFQTTSTLSSLSFAGILLLLISFGFKASAAPLHFWTPDVYDGSPTAFTPFMASIAKVSVFAAFIRIFHNSFGDISDAWQVAIAAMIVLTLLFGNITAVYQQSVKRMMAYSSIAQAGFMLFAIFAVNSIAWQGLLLYSVAYTLASLGVFGVLLRLKDFTFDGFNGLAQKEPVLAATAAICLLSLAGIPLTGGFFAKYFVLSATVAQGKWIVLVIFAVIMAAVSAYYYLRVIQSMYFKSGEPSLQYTTSNYEKALFILNAVLVVLLGILPNLVIGN